MNNYNIIKAIDDFFAQPDEDEYFKKHGHEAHCNIMHPAAECVCTCKANNNKNEVNDHGRQKRRVIKEIDRRKK